eukprot:135761-Amphidinium_carterae.1
MFEEKRHILLQNLQLAAKVRVVLVQLIRFAQQYEEARLSLCVTKCAYPTCETERAKCSTCKKLTDHSWRKDYTGRRSNGWDSDWAPSSSAYTEEKYVPVTIKLLNESPEFMKSGEDYYPTRDKKPVVRLVKSKASTENNGEHDMQVDDEAKPSVSPPPPKGSAPMKWELNEGGETSVKLPPPPPPPPMPPSNQHQKEDEIPDWALEFNAPPAPVVKELELSFVEEKPLVEHEEFYGHAQIKKGHACYVCNEVTFFSGLAWTYCKAGPPVPGSNRARYELKTVMPMNTDVNKVMALQRVKDKAIRKLLEMECLNRQQGINKLEDEFHGAKKTNDGSIRLVCFKCWNANEGTDKYSTFEGKPSAAFRKKTAVLLNTDKMREKYPRNWQDRFTSVGPDCNVALLYSCPFYHISYSFTEVFLVILNLTLQFKSLALISFLTSSAETAHDVACSLEPSNTYTWPVQQQFCSQTEPFQAPRSKIHAPAYIHFLTSVSTHAYHHLVAMAIPV